MRSTDSLRRALALAFLAVHLAGCGGEADRGGAAVAARQAPIDFDALDPALYLSDLEDTLAARQQWQSRFHLASEGAFESELAGTLMFDGDAVTLAATGTFGVDSADLSLDAANGRLTGGNGTDRFEMAAAPALKEALVVGMTRMGLLHNLARLTAGAPPDRMEGGVREWVEISELAWTPPVESDRSGAARGLSFDITVSGQPAGDATLWLDAAGQPIARDQTVRFPGGEMRVREEYELR